MGSFRPFAAFAAACSLATIVPASAAADGHDGYSRIDLVSNQPAMAQLTDPGLVNAWGLAAGPKTPLWVSDNGSDQASIYSGATKHDSAIAVARPPVSIPDGAPTGQVFNDTRGFGGAKFIFASENGAIDAWSSGSSAQTEATVPDAVFKGLALAGPKGHPMLYATDFHHGMVDVFDSSFAPAGSFTDPSVPAGFAPFGIQAVDGRLYVTFAKQDADAEDDVAGPGNGVVDVFRPDGRLQRRLITGGALNSPWGIVVAPGGFGRFGHDLLVGNFGDGAINAYDKNSGKPKGTLTGPGGVPAIDGLWGLRFGNGVTGDPKALLFSAGPDDEANGLLGEVVRAGH
jgi:uncharacterized protein (TIGR03118 family)